MHAAPTKKITLAHWKSTGAAKAYEKILTIEPTHDRAYNTLEQLHTAASRWEPLIELYLARLDSRTETSERTDILRRIAHVFELERFDDRDDEFHMSPPA